MSVIRRHWFPLAAGGICFAWALAGWLTVIPNQDMLADSIQVQSLLHDPRIVLAFPGQKHGGPLEYPVLLISEAIAPGNFYLHTVLRVFFAFLTGFFTAKLYLTLLPNARRWSFLAAIAVGPTIIHGLLGPTGNTVGVWWLQPNWDMAWLFVTSGAYVVARRLVRSEASAPGKSRALTLGVGGLLIGLGFYAHPAISILIVPLITLVAVRCRASLRDYGAVAAGAAIGALPAAVSYVVNAGINTWDPSHGVIVNIPLYGAALGINGLPDYILTLLPYSLGLAPSGSFIPPVGQSMLMWIFIPAVIAASAVGVDRALRGKRRPTPGSAIALSWLAAVVTMVVFSTLIDPVWIYASGLSILFWISVGAMPTMFARRWAGGLATGAVLLVVAGSTLTHNFDWYSQFSTRVVAKQAYMEDQMALADAIEEAGAEYIYGSYYNVIPVGYASGYRLRTITNRYNRFPLTADELSRGQITVAVDMAPKDAWGVDALAVAQSSCTKATAVSDAAIGSYAIFECPPMALADKSP
ncbi:MAG: hypothetical protein F2836_04975 [Actinobacteria bacterium]|uniref:Unannotated protein n=1 Tax=freshwater metagenome TaxID=449393 RepID=A0A6J7J040_9ZZZZ|nr:hypothetical protein [Actinomycetota bacterium]